MDKDIEHGLDGDRNQISKVQYELEHKLTLHTTKLFDSILFMSFFKSIYGSNIDLK
jgi:hypothetical protein